MKNLILVYMLCLLSNSGSTQNAFYDAKYLSTLSIENLQAIKNADSASHNFNLSETSVKNLIAIIAFIDKPFDPSLSIIDVSLLKNTIIEYNNFLAKAATETFGGDGILPALGIGQLVSMISSSTSGESTVSSDLQTKIIDGFAKYFAKEFQKAQFITYMDIFEKTIGKIGELQVLFPKTYEKLKTTNPAKFPELGNEFKEIFDKDLKLILEHLINHIDNHKQTDFIESKLLFLKAVNNNTIKNNQYYPAIKLSIDIGSKLINNYHPAELFNYLDGQYYHKLPTPRNENLFINYLGNVIHGINLLQSNLLDTAKSKTNQFSNIWLSFEDINTLNTISEWTYFTGLIYQQDKDFFNKIFPLTITPQKSRLGDTDIQSVQKIIKNILSVLVEIQAFSSNLSEENIEDNFLKYMEIFIKTIETIEITSVQTMRNEEIANFLKISRYVINIYDNTRKKDYTNTIYYSLLIMEELIGSINKNPNFVEFLDQIDKYGTFMTDVINAENSDDVKNVIKKHAAPPTSFILKRERNFTFSLTGQPGYFVSAERLNGHDKFGFVSGITLPIGFDFTVKTGLNNRENSGSIGFFIQLIDIGAVLNFRISDETTELPEKIEFVQIFSPGGSISYGFKNSPVTIGLGYQYTPQLRHIDLNGNQIFPNGHRIFLRLAWDIPIINIFKTHR